MIVGDVGRWRQISPLLDELLDLAPAQRADRLAALRREDAALAAELAALVAGSARAEAVNFLAGQAELLHDAAHGAAASLAGTRIGAYVLEAALGQGGAGAVWSARRADGRFAGRVAVKLLHPSLIGRTGARRFEREGGILARLSHPHIARLLDAGVTEVGQPYLVLELVTGDRIDHHCDRKRLSVDERVALFRDVLEAVAHAHRHLIIHRDLKPSNILVTADGSVKLLDFGIAKLLEGEADGDADDLTGGRGGLLTPDYAAPEQLRGQGVTTATDVYSLGVLLYQLLTGRHPTAPPHASVAELMRTTLDSDPERLARAVAAGAGTPPWNEAQIAAERDTSIARLKRQLGGDLETIVAKALRKLPAERYPTVDAFLDDLRRWGAGEPVSARPDSLAYRTVRFIGRHRGAVAAGMLTLAAIVAGLIGTLVEARRAEQQSARATHEAELARLERDEAIQQQRLQRGITEFLQLLMRDATGGDPGAMRKQLDRASVLIEQTRFEHPIVKVALMRQIAARYAELGDVGQGTRLLRQAIASVAGTDLAAPSSSVPVNLACSLANYLIDGADLKGARAELDRADALIAAGAQLSPAGKAECRLQRSYLDTEEGAHGSAVAIAREVIDQLAAAGIAEGEQVRVLRSALSRALLAAGDARAAMAVAQPLLVESTAGQGRESTAVLRRSSIVTIATRLGGDPLGALALSEVDRATASHLLGPGRADAAIELEHGRILSELARFDDAAATLARSAAAAESMGRPLLALAARLAEVEAVLAAGRVADAQARFAALAAARATAPEPRQIDALRIAGQLAAAGGDRSAAEAEFDRAAERVAAAPKDGARMHPQLLALARARAELALAAGDRVGALAQADLALAAARRRALAPERSSDVGRALLLRARALEAAERHDEARAEAASARVHLAATLGATHPAARAAALAASASLQTPTR